MQGGAILDITERYRYSLWRSWDQTAPKIGFVMLNPSRADASVNDPTIRRCLGFACFWGFGALEVVNLFAYRSARPQDLLQVNDPIGPDNEAYLASLSDRVDRIVLAWGNWGKLQGRNQVALEILASETLYCLGTTQTQQPRHPLYLHHSCVPTLFQRSDRSSAGAIPLGRNISDLPSPV